MMIGTSFMKAFYALEYQFYRCFHISRAQHFNHLNVEFFYGKRTVEFLDSTLHASVVFLKFVFTLPINRIYERLHMSVFQQLDARTEGAKFLKARHVDTIIVWITNLWSATNDNDFLGLKSREYFYDAFLQGCSSHNRIIDNDEIVALRLHHRHVKPSRYENFLR